MATSRPTLRRVAVLVLAATVLQLVVATLATGLPQFAGKGFGARLVLYPVMMLVVPAVWFWRSRRRAARTTTAAGAGPDAVPWGGFALVMAPFLVDVTGNSLNLYDTVVWWDDANHLVNWFLLCLGLGLVLRVERLEPSWARAAVVVGGGALLAVVWELGEYVAFIRYSAELTTAYTDTLGDEALGTIGAAVAAIVLARRAARAAAGSGSSRAATAPSADG